MFIYNKKGLRNWSPILYQIISFNFLIATIKGDSNSNVKDKTPLDLTHFVSPNASDRSHKPVSANESP